MQVFTLPFKKIICSLLLTGLVMAGKSQAPVVPTFKLTDFAVWGGSASPSTYNSAQSITITNNVSITGNMGSNHLVDAKNDLILKGSILSGNGISIKNNGQITGDFFAAKKAANFQGDVISGVNNISFIGNLTANGKISLKNNVTVKGKVAVPAPAATNYKGPVPTGGIVTVFTMPELPSMPNNTPFDGQVGTTNITNPSQPVSPGVYRKLALTGNKTLTFNGPGNYIFYEADNGSSSNKFVFDFKNTSTGTINIFIIKDARWGRLSVSTKNGNFPARINTEVHGNGSTFGGFSFDLQGPASMPAGSYAWLGNVWAPNGAISVKNFTTPANNTPHILGALWSGKKVSIGDNLILAYQAPVADFNYIDPYYPPPPSGKVADANKVIGAELLSLSQNPAPITSIPENEIFIVDAGKVMIEVVSKTANDNILRGQLVTLGMTGIVDNGPHVFVITGFFPMNKLLQLNTNPRIEYMRPLYPPISNAGQVTTQGDTTMRSHNVRERFGLDGTGVKIGVISDSYNSKLSAQTDVDQGDLPGIKSNGQLNDNPEPVQVLADLPQRGNDEGRAMLQIVHDVAPKAKLAFRTGFLTAGDFAKGIQELASPGLPGGRCDVIVDDITYVTEPFLRDGIVAQAVDQAAAQGITYFSSAGNFGNKSYEAVFNGVTNTAVIPTGQIHRFGSTAAEIYQGINLKPGSYTIVLQWSDEFHSLGSVAGVQTDMDLYLVGTNGFTLFGFNRSNLFGDPFEVCPFTVTEETNAKVMVVRASGAANVRFKYIILRGDGTILDYQAGASSIVGHPNANGAIAVGAMLYANIPPFTPVWPGVASFSSRGGTFTLQNNLFTTRNKPDIIGPNGVNTTVNLGGAPFNDGDPYPNFFGTSAAAPHAAAVGALLIQGRKKFNLQSTVTPGEIRQQLQSSAGKFSYLPGSFSFEGGYGYLQADSAIVQIANARPIISSLEAVVPGAQNGAQPFTVKIKGKYLVDGTQIYVNGVSVTTNVSPDKTEASAIVPAIPNGQDPAFQLYNPAKSPSGIDGGLSEALNFFSSRINVTVRAENKSRKYGQSNPAFTAEILINGVPINQTNVTPVSLKLDGNQLSFTSIATPTSIAGLYGIFPSRTTPLVSNDPLLAQYSFTFVSGTLSVGKMGLKITPNNKSVKYGDEISEITYTYELDQVAGVSPTLPDEVKALHKKYLADNALVVLNGFNNQTPALTETDLMNMSVMTSFQAIRNARKFILENGQLVPLINNISSDRIGDQRFLVDVSAASLQNYKLDSAKSNMIQPFQNAHSRAFVNIKALANGNAKAAVPNGQLQPMVNGQLLAMVNGQLQALVNGQLKALVNGTLVDAADMVFQNGQLLALVNGAWTAVTNGQLVALVNGQAVTVELSVQANGQLQAIVNGQLMALVNGQLQAIINGETLAIVNGQLKALVNGQLMPLVNGQLVAMVNGQLQPLVNGQLMALVNGQLMALVNGELQLVQDLSLANGQLQAIVNGQLQALVNGQLKAMVNGTVTDIPTTGFNLVNGQLQAIVNGQLLAMVNGQLMALVNGQLKALVNGAAVPVESVRQLANSQLQALVNGTYVPITNGQLQALVNGQLLAMVNGQLMAIVNGELTFTVFQNSQLKALVNGQLQPLANNQLKAIVNGQLQDIQYTIANGQLQAIVNGQTWVYANGQLLALVNGQLQPLINNFDVSGVNNNAKTLVLVDEDDINLQSGDVGGMFSMNMITGLNAGTQKLVPGAFVNENFEVTYGLGEVEISPALLIVKANNASKVYGADNPPFTASYSGFAYTDDITSITPPDVVSVATSSSGVGNYPITLSGGNVANYTLIVQSGNLEITKKPLVVTADDKTKAPGEANPPLTISYNGFVGTDTEDDVCIPFVIPPTPKVIDQALRITTYTDVKLNNGTNVIDAAPGQSITLTGHRNTVYNDLTNYCPGCITQLYIGMANAPGLGNVFTNCYDVSLYNLTETGTAQSADLSISFNAPATPGVYYITQVSSWQFNCYDGGEGNPGNNSNDAIAVVVVNISNQNITVSTIATEASPAGTYPITLQGCGYYNPNYEVTLQDGTLTVGTALVGNRGAAAKTFQPVAIEKKLPASKGNKLYPNPGTTVIRLQLSDENDGLSTIQVYDLLGKQTTAPVKRISNGGYDINVSALLKGVYLIKVKAPGGLKTFRFIKI